ncbi:hypothetical protein [Streptomyces sp. SPB074]|uniref:hypothetical protein n=1 Tax=Streptomyces sp. (strain SPB074) TaxID=465543 RepID=UPI00017F0E76|nr:hypothetical protein [Streptomyces sp. SPB074]EDY43946.1 hypothetical protein SSBG_02136 [Streptomyces sp. SPB074]
MTITRVEDLPPDERERPHGINLLPDEPPRELSVRLTEVSTAIQDVTRAYASALRPALEEIARTIRALRDAGLIDQDGKPTQPRNRPAWQSPYGPPPRRR